MPLYMDIHSLPEGTSPEDVAKAHAKDVEIQRKYGVEYHKYWVNETGNKVFCLAHAPNAEAAECVHREAHGMMAEKIIEVQPDVAEVFLGGTETNPAGAVLLPSGGPNERDPGIRTVLFTDVVNDQFSMPTNPVLFDTRYWRPARNVVLSRRSRRFTTAVCPLIVLLICRPPSVSSVTTLLEVTLTDPQRPMSTRALGVVTPVRIVVDAVKAFWPAVPLEPCGPAGP